MGYLVLDVLIDRAPIPDERIDGRLRIGADRYGLTPRMTEVALLAVQGRTYIEIGQQLGVSKDVARLYLARIYRITRAHNRVQLLRILLGETPRFPMLWGSYR